MTALYIIDCLSGYNRAAGATEETPPPSLQRPRQTAHLVIKCLKVQIKDLLHGRHPDTAPCCPFDHVPPLKRRPHRVLTEVTLRLRKKRIWSLLPPVLLLHFYVPVSGFLLFKTSQLCVCLGLCCLCSPSTPHSHTHTHAQVPFDLCRRHTRLHHTLDGGAHHKVTFNLDEPEVCSADLMDWPMAGKCWLMPQITSPSPAPSLFRRRPPPLVRGGPSFTAVCLHFVQKHICK